MLRAPRLALGALLLPILGIGVVLWFLLPGSLASVRFTPSAFGRAASLQPDYWSNHTAAIEGYFYVDDVCAGHDCGTWMLTDRPALGVRAAPPANEVVIVAPQAESGWHQLLRRLAPGWFSRPFPAGARPGERVVISGSIRPGYDGVGPPVLVPGTL